MTLLRRARLAGLLTAVCGVLLLAACEDPSGVGLTILDPGDTDPRTRPVTATDVRLDTLSDFTGFIPSGAGLLTGRVLAGRAEDPLFGTVAATGYVDFSRPPVPPPDFLQTNIERIVLRLQPDYRFGDTTATATFDLYEIAEPWAAATLPSDSSVAAMDKLLVTFSVSARDTLVYVNLPESWVSQRDSLFRDPAFNAQFHGLQLRPRPESRLALGFAGASAALLALSDHTGDARIDTVTYEASAVFSGVQRELPPAAALPPGFLPLQDGPSQGVLFAVRLDTLGGPAVAAGFVRVPADTTLLAQGRGAGFVRPMAQMLALFGVTANGQREQIAEGPYDRRAQAYVFSNVSLGPLFQEAALGRARFVSYAVGFPRAPSTLDVAPVVHTEATPLRAVLLVVPSGD